MAPVSLSERVRALYPFRSRYLTLSDGRRMHYVDEGPEDGEVLVFVHGYPTWSFMFRALLVYYAAQGFRCVAMDHIGFGLSEKPGSRSYHTMDRHMQNFSECMHLLELRNITLVMQGWGGPIALRYAVENPAHVQRLVLINTWAFQDTYAGRQHPLMALIYLPGIGELLLGRLNLMLNVGIQQGTQKLLSPVIMEGYKAPFHEMRSRVALYRFPRLINATLTHPSVRVMRSLENGLSALRRTPTLILWGAHDPVFPVELAAHWKTVFPRATGPVIVHTASHFMVEDEPEAVTLHLDTFIDATREHERATAAY